MMNFLKMLKKIHIALCTFSVHFNLECLKHFSFFFLAPWAFSSVCVRARLILSLACWFSFLKFP